RHGLGDAVQRQVARHLVMRVVHLLETGALEGDRWKLFDVEEVRSFQVGIAFGEVGVDAAGLDLHLDGTVRGVLVVQAKRAGKLIEAAKNVTDPEMLGAEDERGVDGIDLVIVRPRRAGRRQQQSQADEQGRPAKRLSRSHEVLLTAEGLENPGEVLSFQGRLGAARYSIGRQPDHFFGRNALTRASLVVRYGPSIRSRQ